MMRWRTMHRYTATVLAQAAILSLGIVSGILSARLLGPSGRGILAAITIWPLALVFLCSCGLNQAIVFHLSKLQHSYARICGSVLAIGAVQSVIVVLAGILVLPMVLRRYPPEVLRLGFWFLAFTPILMLSGYPANVLQALHSGRAFNAVRTIAAATYVLGLVVLVAGGASGVGKVVAVQLAGYVAALSIGIAVLFAKFKVRPAACTAAMRDLVSYGTRAQVTSLTTYFNQRCDQLVLSVLVPPRELGLYAVAVTLAMAATFVPQAVGMVTFADGASQGTESARRTIAMSFRLSLAWLITVCVLLFIAAPFLVNIAFGPDFAGASIACRILLPGMLAAGLNQVLYAGANAMGQPALPSFAELAGMVVTIIGLVALVPRYGYIAAAAISTVAYVTSFLAMLWLSASRLGLHIYEMIFQELDSAIPQLERSA
jgi:O-antigen/teichoic acid export membrane protein